MPDELYIQCLKLSKVFKDFWMRDRVRAVDEIDLDVRRGEVFGLLGPNGSGKSTTIKMILGLLHPSSGRIVVLGKLPRDVSIKEHIGYLPEESYLYKFLNARETLEYYGKLFHQDRRKRQRRIDMLLEMVGLDKVQRRPIGEYSKGMQRRIGLAQALINDPKLLILDEPTTGMDPIGTKQIKDLIVRLKDAGKTVLLCSHLLADVEDVTDRCAIMFGGKVRRAGTIDELLTRHDETTITTPALDEQHEQRLVAAMEAAGVADIAVHRGRQRLEALFLDIVEEAQRTGLATAGAGNAGQVAAFLTEANTLEGMDAQDADGNGGNGSAVIDSLVVETPELVSASPAVSNPPPTDQPELVAESETNDVLSELTGDKPPMEPASPSSPAKPIKPDTADSPAPDTDTDRSVIDDLLK
ncbi:MAG: ABC transporter ATP-binding protein [Planctomycetota bacterium]